MLGPIALPLQETFDVSGNLLPLPGKILAFDKFLRRRNQVSPGTLGNIHAGVSHPDDVFDREPVHGEAGHAKAAGDAVLHQHGIAGQPLPQAFR